MKRSLIWSVTGIVGLSAIVWLILIFVPKTRPNETDGPVALSPIEMVDAKDRNPPVEPESAAPQEAEIAGESRLREPVERDQERASVSPDESTLDPPRIPETQQRESATDEALPKNLSEPEIPATPEKRRRPTESWIVHETSSLVRPFLVGQCPGPWFRPAPRGRRFVIVKASMTWDGAGPQDLALRAEDVGRPRLWLRIDQRRVYCVGRLPTNWRPLIPLSRELISFEPQTGFEGTFAFLIPNEARYASLEVERQVLARLEFPPAPKADIKWLVGNWRRVPAHRRPMRHADPLVDTIAGADCRSIRFMKDLHVSVRLLIPCAQAESDPVSGSGAKAGFALTLTAGSKNYGAYVRVVRRDPSLLLLYVGGTTGGEGFLYERYHD